MTTTATKLSDYLDRTTCVHCRTMAEMAPQNEHGWSDLASQYQCGAAIDVALGHIYVATRTGKTALCIVPTR